jgi:hypothetical protein
MVSQLHYFGLKLRQKNMVAGARRRGGCSPRHSQKAEREREREREGEREREREGEREREREKGARYKTPFKDVSPVPYFLQ